MSKKSNGKKELSILVGVVLAGIAVFAVVQILLTGVQDGGFSKLADDMSTNEFYEKIDNDEDFILMYGAASCSFCEEYKPIMADVVKGEFEDVPLYYIDADTLSDDDRTSISSYLGVTSTPTTYIIIDGSITEIIEGKKTTEETREFFELYKSYSK